jgi:hypothetical protein
VVYQRLCLPGERAGTSRDHRDDEQ